jgi:type II secretory pathway pseudopilin PulG
MHSWKKNQISWRRATRAFTLLEVTVATALTAVLMVMVLQWVGQLARSGALGGIKRQAERDSTWVYMNLSRDAAAAGPCDTDNLKPAIAGMSKLQLQLHVDDDLDGIRDLVTWTVSGKTVVRSVVKATVPCNFSGTTISNVVISDMVMTGTTEVFRPLGGGDDTARAGNTVTSCVANATACATSGSLWTGARVTLIFVNSVGDPLTKLDDAVSWGLA